MAALPDAELPRLGADGVLSIGRRVRVQRSIAGCDGPGAFGTRADAGTPVKGGRAAISRRRRATLVASAGGTRRANPFFGRLPVASVRRVPIRQMSGRHRCTGRKGSVFGWAKSHARGGGVLRSAQPN